MTNREIAQEISNRIGNSPVPFDSVYSIALQIYNELGGEATQFDSVYSILLEILPLVASGKDSVIDVDVLPDAELNKGKLVRYEGNLYYAKPEEIKAVKFTALKDSTDISLTAIKSTQIIERSYDAENWVVCVVDDVITLNEGESVYFRGYYTGEAESTNTKFGGTTGKLKLEGNINTLINYTASDLGSNFEVPAYACKSMFGGLKNLVDVSELYFPSMNLSEQCYYYMFVTAPITSAPVLPATTLASECYRFMFQNCKQLKTAQNIFPATTLAYRSYQSMFMGCSELSNDFTILAATLEDSACLNMFKNANKVNYIKCLATDISATDCTKTWVDGVAPTGTFVKASSMNDWSTGTSGIPEGWEVANDDTIPEFNYEWHGVYKYNWTELPTKQYVDDAIQDVVNGKANKVDYVIPVDMMTQSLDWSALNAVTQTGMYHCAARVDYMGTQIDMGCYYLSVVNMSNGRILQTLFKLDNSAIAQYGETRVALYSRSSTDNGSTWTNMTELYLPSINDGTVTSSQALATVYSRSKVDSLISALDARIAALESNTTVS